MRNRVVLLGLVLLAGEALVVPASAEAQGAATSKFFVDLNGAGQFTGVKSITTLTFPIYEEDANVVVIRPLNQGRLIDVRGGVLLWRRWGVAAGVSKLSTRARGSYSARIPDPTFFDQPRSAAGDVTGMGHAERQIAVLAVYSASIGERFTLRLAFGGTQTKVEHDAATSATVLEEESGPSVSVGLTRMVRTVKGYEVGMDVGYWPLDRIGVGSFVRFSRARADLGGTISLGGVFAGGGLRIRF